MYREIEKQELRVNKGNGYLYFSDGEHPLSYDNGIVYYHRHIASVDAGRWLSGDEHVHHVDGDRLNNDPSNLEVMTNAEHAALHKPAPVERLCAECNDQVSVGSARADKADVFCSHKCAMSAREVVDWPPAAVLVKMVDSTSYCAVGRVLGVSDNAVRKRIKNHS